MTFQRTRGFAFSTLAALGFMATAAPAVAQDTPFIGEVMIVGFNFCPRGWASAEGQLLPISQNTALFSLLGTTYGGDGRTTFALPDLRGRVAINAGAGPGLANHREGARGGVENNAVSMPSHTHSVAVTAQGSPTPGNGATPAGALLALSPGSTIYGAGTGPVVPMAPAATAVTQTAQGISATSESNMQPFLVMKYCVALQGIFPSRS